MRDDKAGVEAPKALDQEAFRRVWQRVMPEDRADCPFTVEPPGQKKAPPPPMTAGAGQRPSVGARPPVVPNPPAGSRPPAPARPPAGPRPPAGQGPGGVCLGEAAKGELAGLDRALEAAREGQGVYLALRKKRPGSALLRTLAQTKAEQVRRLAAARFLITGKPYRPRGTAPAIVSVEMALRDRHRAEQEEAMELQRMAGTAGDPWLRELYRQLALENQALAGKIRAALERSGAGLIPAPGSSRRR